MKILFVLQVSAVLAYSHENIVDPFLEPVLGLAQVLLEKDQQEMHRNMDGIVPAGPSPPPHPLNPHPSLSVNTRVNQACIGKGSAGCRQAHFTVSRLCLRSHVQQTCLRCAAELLCTWRETNISLTVQEQMCKCCRYQVCPVKEKRFKWPIFVALQGFLLERLYSSFLKSSI